MIFSSFHRAAVNTIMASVGGGTTALIICMVYSRVQKTLSTTYDVGLIMNAILGSLVSITSICTMCHPWQAILIGSFGALLCFFSDLFFYAMKIDDPVGVLPVHLVAAVWGLLSVGLFVEPHHTFGEAEGTGGLFITGEYYLLVVQIANVLCITVWTAITSFIVLKVIILVYSLSYYGLQSLHQQAMLNS